jgi:hypothetical protein
MSLKIQGGYQGDASRILDHIVEPTGAATVMVFDKMYRPLYIIKLAPLNFEKVVVLNTVAMTVEYCPANADALGKLIDEFCRFDYNTCNLLFTPKI